MDFLENILWGERVSHYAIAIAIIVGALLLRRPIAHGISTLGYLLVRRFSNEKHGQKFRSLIIRPLELTLSTLAIYIATLQLGNLLDQIIVRRIQGERKLLVLRIGDVTDKILFLLLIAFGAWTVSRVLDYIYYAQREDAINDGDKSRQQLLPLIKEVIKLLLWTIAVFWILGDVFNVNIPALITGLGIGGVAIALAAKESVENLFAAFTILSDHPFEAGDVIRLGTLEGTVERIGFRSTRLRGADGSAFIIPNRKLVAETLENLSNRDSRRVKLVVNIKYGLSREDLEKSMDRIRKVILSTPQVVAPVTVWIENFNEGAMQLLITYRLPHPMENGSPDEVRQAIHLAVYEVLERQVGGGVVTAVATEENPAAPEPPEEEEPRPAIG